MAKNYDELTFTDDFMFCKVLENNPEICRELLEMILNVKIRKIVCTNKQKTIEITSDGKGIRLDVYLEDAENTIYDIEMQTTEQKDLPKRSRYYQGMIDLNLIERGAKYKELKKSYIIFICLSDPFKKGFPLYHFYNTCKEMPDLQLNDEAHKLFVNAKGNIDNATDNMKAFLQYLCGMKTDNSFIKKIDSAVEQAIKHDEWRTEYMTLLMRDKEKKEEGFSNAIEVMTYLKKNPFEPDEAIAELFSCTSEDVAKIRQAINA